MPLAINSPAFPAQQKIPQQFSRDGGNVSPPIEWRDAPAGTRSFALIVEDPDAPKGTFRHWAAYDIPSDTRQLSEAAGSRESAPTLQMGRNDFGNARYDGPQPPPGHGTHHYHFRLFALDVPELEVSPDSPASEILAAAEEHALEQAEVIGLFEKSDGPGIQPHIADADKIARTGSTNERIRNTPPAGDWNDTA